MDAVYFHQLCRLPIFPCEQEEQLLGEANRLLKLHSVTFSCEVLSIKLEVYQFVLLDDLDHHWSSFLHEVVESESLVGFFDLPLVSISVTIKVVD